MSLNGFFLWFILLWVVVLISLFAIGGYFMFRKFLKRMPKQDGWSELDWQEHYIKNTIHLWSKSEKDLLEELVSPVPELFRDVARERIAGQIGKLALEENASSITRALLIKGYIVATPKRDHNFLRKKCKELQIDLTPYEGFFQQSPELGVTSKIAK
ncbi:DUF2621 domain-containing protein [Mangrovibacillus cuniculi]|uniref:DUF2621 domain-containing protein n=1 Tax=Mangrovibacillus cuniculi TaxID=2593652 RepID=A0A7S8CAK9_9BACI|nr:DUF2621 domain-containing protein [Mangrovibacillus cuniculi]QPC46449.1 DUF2621 domain-containing protein [Mangrovibacillus cuniculi]